MNNNEIFNNPRMKCFKCKKRSNHNEVIRKDGTYLKCRNCGNSFKRLRKRTKNNIH